MNKIDRYQGITRALLEIEYDNGGINRDRTENDALLESEEVLASCDDADLAEIDSWLASLNPEELQLVCCGEQSEAEEFMTRRAAPTKTNGLLNDLFKH